MFVSVSPQDSTKSLQAEQSTFSLQGEPVRHPIEIPKAALKALSGDDVVIRCLKYKEIRLEQLPAQWFVAASIHLDGSAKTDLVVLPRMLLDHPEKEKSESGCWDGVKSDPFWILRRTGRGYSVVLSESADALEILPEKTHGLRDIGLLSFSDDSSGYQAMKFNGKAYLREKWSR